MCRFEFHKAEWSHVSAEARDLISGLLVKVSYTFKFVISPKNPYLQKLASYLESNPSLHLSTFK
jgi:hypothetical protein